MFIDFCSLASGSSGNCQYVSAGDKHFLVDLGLTAKYVVNALSHLNVSPDMITGIFISHEHSDHVKGVGAFHRKYKTPIYCHKMAWHVLEKTFGKYHQELVHFVEPGQIISIGDTEIEPISISHDAAAPLAYIFQYVPLNISIGIATDLGCIDEDLLKAFNRVQMLLLEANHNVDMLLRGSYPFPLKRRVLSEIGHLSNEDCAKAISYLFKNGALKSVFLGHLSLENNTPDLAYETIRSALALEDIIVDKDIMIEMTYRNRVGKCIRIRN